VSPRLPWSLVAITGSVMILLLILPVLVLVVQALRPAFVATLLSPTVTEALKLSLTTSSISLALTILFGTPVAYLLVRYHFPGKRLLNPLLDLPLVLPPVVAGIGLLLIFGRRGLIGEPLSELGVSIAFTSTAVVLAQIFVASPLFIRAMKVGFSGTLPQLEAAALTLSATRYAVILVEGLEADGERMRANIDARGGFVFAEPVMRLLAERVGKHTAHDIMYEAAMRGVEEGVSFAEALMSDPRAPSHLSRSDIEEQSDLGRVMGAGPLFVDRVIRAAG